MTNWLFRSGLLILIATLSACTTQLPLVSHAHVGHALTTEVATGDRLLEQRVDGDRLEVTREVEGVRVAVTVGAYPVVAGGENADAVATDADVLAGREGAAARPDAEIEVREAGDAS